jgi:hypothetical protein
MTAGDFLGQQGVALCPQCARLPLGSKGLPQNENGTRCLSLDHRRGVTHDTSITPTVAAIRVPVRGSFVARL